MKKVSFHFRNVLFVVVSLFLLSSCDAIVDEIFECIINKGPELSEKQLAVGNVEEFYSDYIRGAIQNEPYDDEYEYYFSISGDLPPGIEYFIDYRKVIFEGTPLKTGEFTITIELDVVGPGVWVEESQTWEEDMCTTYIEREYVLKVQDL